MTTAEVVVIRLETWVEPLDRPANSYLVSAGGLKFLIDAGVGQLPKEALEAPYVLLTHWHWDHVLGLARSRYAGTLCASPRTISYLRGSPPAYEGSAAALRAFGDVPEELKPMLQVGLSRISEIKEYMKSVESVRTFNECEPVARGLVRVLECPGHSDDHTCFIVGSHAFVGDSVNPGSGLSVLDINDYIRSMELLLSDPRWLTAHPGHGPDVDRAYVSSWVAETLISKVRKLIKMRSLLSPDWRPLKDYLELLYGSENAFAKWVGARSLLGYAISLAKMGLAELNTEVQPWTIRAKEA